MSTRKIKMLTINSLLGFDELKIEFGDKRTEIRGRNGIGKSSIVKALITALGTGYPVDYVRVGHDESEIGIIFNDDTTIEKHIFREKKAGKYGTSNVIDEMGRSISKSSNYFTKKVPQFSFNPTEFITADKNSRIDLLLKALPLEINKDDVFPIFTGIFEKEEIQEVFMSVFGKQDFMKLINRTLDNHALLSIDTFITAFFNKRTDINSRQKKAEETASRLKASISGMAIVENIEEDKKTLIDKTQALNDISGMKEKNIKDNYSQERKKVFDYSNKRIEEERTKEKVEIEGIGKKYDKEIYELQVKINQLMLEKKEIISKTEKGYLGFYEAFNKEIRNKNEEIDKKENEDMEDVKAKLRDDLVPINENLIALREQEKNQAGIEKLQEEMKLHSEDSQDLRKRSEKFTKVIENFRKLKKEILKDLPIEGLDIRDGEIYYNEVLFDTDNTQSQIELAAEISSYYCDISGLKLAFWDGMERLDSEHLKYLLDLYEKKGIQLLYTVRTDDEELVINTE